VQEQSGVKTRWREFANLMSKIKRTCLAKQDQADAYMQATGKL